MIVKYLKKSIRFEMILMSTICWKKMFKTVKKIRNTLILFQFKNEYRYFLQNEFIDEILLSIKNDFQESQ